METVNGWEYSPARNSYFPLKKNIADRDAVGELLLQSAENSNGSLYAIMDGARHPSLLSLMAANEVKYRSLYDNTFDIRYFAVSPFLIDGKNETAIFQWMTGEAWGESSGIFLISASSYDEIFTHSQQFTKVQIEEDNTVFFRYYDPRVLPVYLPTCTYDEIEQFFGPVTQFLFENETGESILVFDRETRLTFLQEQEQLMQPSR